jgi:hypothetical protein
MDVKLYHLLLIQTGKLRSVMFMFNLSVSCEFSVICVAINDDNSQLVTCGYDAAGRVQIIVWDVQVIRYESICVFTALSVKIGTIGKQFNNWNWWRNR